MQYRTLGQSGIKVSPICLGTMMFGDRTDTATADRIVGSARDAGVNFIDTADQYAMGESERITGALIKGDRRHWVLATKAGNPMSDDPNHRGISRHWLMQAIDDSLRRLGTDYVDIWYMHLDDETTPIEETVQAVGDILRSGKARYFGISNYRAWRMVELIRTCRELGVPRPVVLQPYYNAMNRMPENELLPACEYFGLGVAPFSPLARGVLTGKYQPGQEPPPETRAGRKDPRMMQTEFRPESIAFARDLARRAEGKGMTAGQFAVNWVLRNAIVSSVIAGPRTMEQWTEYLGALDHRLDDDDEAFVDVFVKAGHPSTPGYSDPKFPIRGRVLRRD